MTLGAVTGEHVHTVTGSYLDPAGAHALLELARPSIHLTKAAAGAAPTGRQWGAHPSPEAAQLLAAPLAHVPGLLTRFGGLPLMPVNVGWPRFRNSPLSLLAVLDTAALRAWDSDLPLPEHDVLLNFFYDMRQANMWPEGLASKGRWRVVAADPRSAVLREPPAGAITFPAWPAVGRQVLTLPGWQEDVFSLGYDDLDSPGIRGLLAALDAFDEMAFGDAARHQFGGWPCLVQAPLWAECSLHAAGIPALTREAERHPRFATVLEGSADWRLLLQLDSDTSLGWLWGDNGCLYYAVRDEDLRRGDFDGTWMVFQGG